MTGNWKLDKFSLFDTVVRLFEFAASHIAIFFKMYIDNFFFVFVVSYILKILKVLFW